MIADTKKVLIFYHLTQLPLLYLKSEILYSKIEISKPMMRINLTQ